MDWTCKRCGLEHRPVEVKDGHVPRCSACRTRLNHGRYRESSVSLMWTRLALVLFFLASRLHILEVSKAGLSEDASILVAWKGLSLSGMPVLGSIAGAFVVWFPITALLLLAMLNLGALLRWRFPCWHTCFQVLSFARQWAMPEVFILAVLVAFLKIEDLADTSPESGLWILAGASVAMLAAFDRMDKDNLLLAYGLNQHRSKRPSSLQPPLAFMLTALILLIPANLLPIMTVVSNSGSNSSTIFSGISSLVEHGMWGIAATVFTASILVPFGKIAGLGWLIWVTQRPLSGLAAPRIYAIIAFIGRWSMLDIFLIALLAGLIRFEGLAEIRPGAAAAPFAAAVIFTVLAVEQFDTGRIRAASSTSIQD